MQTNKRGRRPIKLYLQKRAGGQVCGRLEFVTPVPAASTWQCGRWIQRTDKTVKQPAHGTGSPVLGDVRLLLPVLGAASSVAVEVTTLSLVCLFSALYGSSELSRRYLARSSPTSQHHILLYLAKTTYLCWGHLAQAVRWVWRCPWASCPRCLGWFPGVQGATRQGPCTVERDTPGFGNPKVLCR